MAGRPRLLPSKFGKATPTWKLWLAHQQSRNEIYGLLLATFSIIPSVVESHFHPSPNRHFDPLAPSFCEAGAGQPFVVTKILRTCGATPVGPAKSATSPFRC